MPRPPHWALPETTSGAVLPGVTVEASSPALIEKTRSVVTGGTGQYAIVDLRPGTYTVTFALPGFNTVKREGIELTGNFVASVSVEMRVGAVAETVTVSGEAPIVDVTNSRRQQTISGDVIAAIPSSRQYFGLTTLVPALNIQGNDIGGASGPIFSVFQIHGGRRNEGQVLVDGLSMGFQGMGVSFYVPEVGTAQEVTFSLSGGLGEAPTGGPQMNIVPRAGGNVFSGSLFVTGANGAMQGDNITQEIRDAGLTGRNELKKLWEVNPALGGPIRRDRLWFYGTFRHQGNRQLVAGMFENRNAGDPTKWTYDPDPSRQAIDDGTWKNGSLRLTWQATPRNKVNVWWDEQTVCQHCIGGGSRTGLVFAGGIQSPEAHGRTEGFPQRMAQATWSSPASNRLLLEASLGLGPDIQFGGLQKNPYDKTLIRVTDQGGAIPNLAYRAAFWSRPRGLTRVAQGSLSYVTGSHNAKFGGRYHYNDSLGVNFYNDSQLSYTFLNGSPTQLTMFGNHDVRQLVTQGMASLYAQDQWTRGRLTLQGGVRFEHLSAEFPDQQIGPNLFIPTAITFSARDSGVGVKDIMPRMGAAYDLFGNGRTAVKLSLGRYVTPTNSTEAYAGGQNPVNRVVTMTNRAWTDSNRNFVPDCDLLNPALNRRLWTLVEPELWERGLRHDIRSRSSHRLEQARVQLGFDHDSQPTAGATGLSRVELCAPRVGQLPGYGQPRRRAGRLRPVHDRRAARTAVAERRRLFASVLRRQADEVRTVRQLHHVRGQLRQADLSLQRHRPERECPVPFRADATGRLQHRQHDGRRL